MNEPILSTMRSGRPGHQHVDDPDPTMDLVVLTDDEMAHVAGGQPDRMQDAYGTPVLAPSGSA